MRIARKFVLALVAGIVAVHLVAAIVRVDRERTLFEEDVTRDARILGRTLAHAAEQAWRTSGRSEALAIIRYAAEQEPDLDVRWVWLDEEADGETTPVAPLDRLSGLERERPIAFRPTNADGPVYTYVFVRAPFGREGAIEIQDSLAFEREYLERSIYNATAWALILVVLSGLLAVVLGYALIGRPVRRVIEHARAVGRGELDERLDLPAKDELGDLARELNAMTEQLETARSRWIEESERRITAIEQLRHADRLSTVGRLASGIAHELGTPLNVVAGHAQLIRENPRVDARAKDNAGVIARQCKRMEEIIRQLLDFSRRGGRSESTADAREVANDTLRMVTPLVRKHGIETSFEAEEVAARVNITVGRLQQVVTNLVMNAIHAMPRGGHLSVRVEQVRTVRPESDAPESPHVRIDVEDTGVGMDREMRDHIFEPFFTTKDVGEGTGLGLSVAYGILADHGGWIEVASEPGAGSRFSLYLPVEGAG